MAMCPLVFGQGSTLLRRLRPGSVGHACPNGVATTDFRLMLKFMKILFLLLLTLQISVCLRSKGDQLSAEIFNDKDDRKVQSSREDTNIEYFLVAAGRSHLYLMNECHLLLNGLKTYRSCSTTPNCS